MVVQMKKALRHPRKALSAATYEFQRAFFWKKRCAAIREPKHIGPLPDPGSSAEQLVQALRDAGLEPVALRVDVNDYSGYLARANYQRFPEYLGGGRDPRFHEKTLEHYLAAKILDLDPGDVYVDVANYESPTPVIYEQVYGCTSYRQDLLFPPGLRGRTIGGDAAAMPVSDGFASKMALHCSFEHFEGDADSRFIRECGRVLRPGGRVCIVPLYLFTEYACMTDPIVSAYGDVPFERDATVYCVPGFRNRFGRHYDIPHFCSRVREHLDGLRLTVYAISNAREVHESCYVRFMAVLEKPNEGGAGSIRQ